MNSSQRNKEWFKRHWLDCVLFATGAGMLLWIGILVHGTYSNKVGWLIIPLTAIYVVTNIYVAFANIKSAKASERSVIAMEQNVAEMRRQTNALYSPTISFPEDYKCWLKPNDTIELLLTNLTEQPALRLQAFVWEMEASNVGSKECKFSSLRESLPVDFLGDSKGQKFVLKLSKRTEAEKIKDAQLALKRFQEVYGKAPDRGLCALQYSTKVSNGLIILVYDLTILQPTENEKREHISFSIIPPD